MSEKKKGAVGVAGIGDPANVEKATGTPVAEKPAAATPANGKPVKTKRQRFEELAPKRMNKILTAFRGIRRLAQRASYDYTEVEGEKIVKDIIAECQSVENAFKGQKGAPKLWTL